MDRYEEAVLDYITRNGTTGVFVCPQWDAIEKWSQCPDFVALQPRKRKIYVIEVSAAGSPDKLREKLTRRDWLDKIKDHLVNKKDVAPDWTLEVIVFVRNEVCDSWLTKKADFAPTKPAICALEPILPLWNAWNSNRPFDF